MMPHWPQPGLLPRLKERGNRIENMVFKGRKLNLYHEFRSPEFRASLASLGVSLTIDDKLVTRCPTGTITARPTWSWPYAT